MNNGFLVPVQYTCALSLVIAPHGEKFGGRMVVIFVGHFSDKV